MPRRGRPLFGGARRVTLPVGRSGAAFPRRLSDEPPDGRAAVGGVPQYDYAAMLLVVTSPVQAKAQELLELALATTKSWGWCGWKRKSKVKAQKSKVKKIYPQPLTPSTQEAEACFLQAIEIARQSAGQVPGTARRDEPRPAAAVPSSDAGPLLTRNRRSVLIKHTKCYPRSITGSPKGSIRRICKRRGRCWRSCHKGRTFGSSCKLRFLSRGRRSADGCDGVTL